MITHSKLMELIAYNPETGALFWKVAGKGRTLGKIAGSISRKGYREIGIDYKIYYAHRLVWLYIHGRWPYDQIDHINLVRDDNRLCNLRESNQTENKGNTRKHCNNRSGFKGVCWHRQCKKWQASIKINGTQTYLGLFDDLSAAAAAYERAAKTHFGEFARVA